MVDKWLIAVVIYSRHLETTENIIDLYLCRNIYIKIYMRYEVFRAWWDSIPAVKPASWYIYVEAWFGETIVNSEADSKVWMEEVILKLVIHNVIIVEWMAGLNVDTGSEMNYYLRVFLIVRVRIWL